MKQYEVPLFIPFNVRNQIINENHPTRKLDINEYKPDDQVQILLSYLKEKQIQKALKKANFDKIFKQRNRSPVYDMNIRKGFFKIPDLQFINDTARRGGLIIHRNRHLLTNVISGAGLKAYWRFNQASGTVTNDAGNVAGNASLGTSADVTMTGGTFNQPSGITNINYSMLFNGTSDVGVSGSSVSQFNFLHNTSALWTILWWMKGTGTSGNRAVLGNGDSWETSQTTGISLGLDTSTTFHPVVGNGTSPVCLIAQANYVPDQTNWYFYSITFDVSLVNTNMNLRRNVANLVSGDKTAQTPSNSNAPIALKVGNDSQGSHWFKGNEEEISVWNRVLSTGEQTSIYNGGNGFVLY